MPCPRCDGPLVELSLGDSVTSVCEECGHVGISTDLHTLIKPDEPWEESLRRFRDRG